MKNMNTITAIAVLVLCVGCENAVRFKTQEIIRFDRVTHDEDLNYLVSRPFEGAELDTLKVMLRQRNWPFYVDQDGMIWIPSDGQNEIGFLMGISLELGLKMDQE